uniref:EGF-like domain-containing protein n=1 Tax=Branchiostoma floridae TaxID=7739 RepID=C3Y4N2_BRAFL|eukprot:XP_002608679.1 hypothetical protein BRAFLDRAFT_73901 [Branchiostoma floridae]
MAGPSSNILVLWIVMALCLLGETCGQQSSSEATKKSNAVDTVYIFKQALYLHIAAVSYRYSREDVGIMSDLFGRTQNSSDWTRLHHLQDVEGHLEQVLKKEKMQLERMWELVSLVEGSCLASPCDAKAACTNTAGPALRATCTCMTGYTGDGFISGTGCSDMDVCLSNPCDTKATCKDNPAPALDATCTCTSGYTGDGLRTGSGCSDINACLVNPCHAKATCTDNPAPALDATCTCNAGYTGDGLVSGSGCSDQYPMMLKKLGCWADKWLDRTMPSLEGTDKRLDGRHGNGFYMGYMARTDPVKKCYKVAKDRGYKVFAVQDSGECRSSATAGDTYKKHGPSTECIGGEGYAWLNDVYEIMDA